MPAQFTNTMRYIFMFLALLAGCILPIQASINAKLGSYLKTPLMAALINFLVGLLILLFFVIGSRTPNNIYQAIKEAPAFSWIGGLLGATYVTSIIFLVPRLGAALSFGLIVAGQLIFSLVIDHYGIFGVPTQGINAGKVAGVVLIIAGVIMIRKF